MSLKESTGAWDGSFQLENENDSFREYVCRIVRLLLEAVDNRLVTPGESTAVENLHKG